MKHKKVVVNQQGGSLSVSWELIGELEKSHVVAVEELKARFMALGKKTGHSEVTDSPEERWKKLTSGELMPALQSHPDIRYFESLPEAIFRQSISRYLSHHPEDFILVQAVEKLGPRASAPGALLKIQITQDNSSIEE